jgi:hypothetical protein
MSVKKLTKLISEKKKLLKKVDSIKLKIENENLRLLKTWTKPFLNDGVTRRRIDRIEGTSTPNITYYFVTQESGNGIIMTVLGSLNKIIVKKDFYEKLTESQQTALSKEIRKKFPTYAENIWIQSHFIGW